MNAIVVVDQNWAIGLEGGLLFSLPTDMKRFRTMTTGGTVVMGRKTFESFPGGRPLPNRRNIVITHNTDFSREGAEVAFSTEEALKMTESEDPNKLWIIGGGSVYATLLSRCERVYLTRVETQVEESDTYFPNLDKLPGWEVEQTGEPITENGFTYRFVDYINTKI
ncbi:dihydrofolate reductase [uncultured Dysosmobacter sp.]|uniref:dihydrofolate reductase n=1 Tax=uncultured Dysosmobacter sp. TaxID=2591384 RepID=UPI00261812BD|nr:dihydrofolate reductase [uncultured Dysosmobacter sp.]